MIDWRTLLPIAGSLLESLASSYGPLPGAVATFAIDSLEYTIGAVEAGTDRVTIIQEMQTRTAKLLVELESAAVV